MPLGGPPAWGLNLEGDRKAYCAVPGAESHLSALASKAARIAAAFCARSPGVVQPPSSYDQNHKGWRETPRLEATPASILIPAGRLDVRLI